MPLVGPATRFPVLKTALPPLVRKQRRHAARIALVAPDVAEEKAVRAQIDVLLRAAGLGPSEYVTCEGYDVRHHEKAGQTRVNEDQRTELLVAGGVDRDFVLKTLADCTETGAPAVFATVTPSKGAKVRA